MKDRADDRAILGLTAEHALGKRVAELRRARGWSQSELAQRMSAAGFSWRQTTVAKTEKADRPVRVNEAAALAELFGAELEQLVTPNLPALLERLEAARQELRAIDATLARAHAEAVHAECDRESTRSRVEAIEAVVRFWRDPTGETMANATAAALYWCGDDWSDLLAEAGVPRAVLDEAEKWVGSQLAIDRRQDDENAFDQINRLTTTWLLHWFEHTERGRDDDGEHREAP